MIAPIFHHVVPKSQQEQHGAKEWETIFHSFFTHVFSMAARGASVRPGRFLPAVFFLGGWLWGHPNHRFLLVGNSKN
jgi:hypothetical protein